MELPKKFADLQDPSIRQTKEILQISNATVWRLCKRGVLKKYKLGNVVRIRLDSIESLRNSGVANE